MPFVPKLNSRRFSFNNNIVDIMEILWTFSKSPGHLISTASLDSQRWTFSKSPLLRWTVNSGHLVNVHALLRQRINGGWTFIAIVNP